MTAPKIVLCLACGLLAVTTLCWWYRRIIASSLWRLCTRHAPPKFWAKQLVVLRTDTGEQVHCHVRKMTFVLQPCDGPNGALCTCYLYTLVVENTGQVHVDMPEFRVVSAS